MSKARNLADLGDDFDGSDLILSGGVYLGGTGAANKLDDYETGSWTPALEINNGSTGISYNAQEGVYTKVGRLVTAIAALHLSSKGSRTGNVKISGLPFTIGDQLTSSSFNGFASVYFSGLASSASQIQGWLDDGTTSILMRHVDGGGNTDVQNTTNAKISNTTDFRFLITYYTS